MKSANLWKFVIVMTAANNCVYGSLLSPGRMFQIQQAVASYMEHTNPMECQFFFYHLPFLIVQLELDVKMTDDGVHEVGLDTSW